MEKTKSFSCRVSQELYDKFSKSLIGGITISEQLRTYIEMFANDVNVFLVTKEELKDYNIGFEKGCVKNKIVSTKISDELRNKLLKRIGETLDIPTKTDEVIRLIMICHITRQGLIMGTHCTNNCAKVVKNENSSVVEDGISDYEWDCECDAESSDSCGEKSWFGRLIERMVRFLRERFFSI